MAGGRICAFYRFSVSEEDYDLNSVIALGNDVNNYISVAANGNSIVVTWNDQSILKFGYYSGGKFQDFIAFRKHGSKN